MGDWVDLLEKVPDWAWKSIGVVIFILLLFLAGSSFYLAATKKDDQTKHIIYGVVCTIPLVLTLLFMIEPSTNMSKKLM